MELSHDTKDAGNWLHEPAKRGHRARALRIQSGRVLEMAESSTDKQTYEGKITDRFGGQKEFEFIIPPASPSNEQEAAN